MSGENARQEHFAEGFSGLLQNEMLFLP